MESIFDLLAVFLFLATVGLFIMRARHESPPIIPYLLVVAVSVVGGWLGNHGGGIAAVALLIAGSFLTLHLASLPFGEEPEETPDP
ncbi:MAG: hypothetical protein GXP04_10980 [Alphaproteobacteria bacterium]|nr:hypothetical protein [Alphaproteobacteria bacterium]